MHVIFNFITLCSVLDPPYLSSIHMARRFWTGFCSHLFYANAVSASLIIFQQVMNCCSGRCFSSSFDRSSESFFSEYLYHLYHFLSIDINLFIHCKSRRRFHNLADWSSLLVASIGSLWPLTAKPSIIWGAIPGSCCLGNLKTWRRSLLLVLSFSKWLSDGAFERYNGV